MTTMDDHWSLVEDYDRLQQSYDDLRDEHALLHAVSVELMRSLELFMSHNCKEENENWNEPCPVGERARAAVARAKLLIPQD